MARGGLRPQPGIRLHRPTRPGPVEIVDGLPCTSVAATIIDLASVEDRPSVERLLDRAEELRTFDLAAFDREIAARGRGAGVPALSEILDDRLLHGSDLLRSVLEREFRALVLERRGIRVWTNTVVRTPLGPFEVDAQIPGLALAIELEGARHHDGLGARRRDTARDAALRAAGWTVLRLRWHQVVVEPGLALAALDRAIAVAPSIAAVDPPARWSGSDASARRPARRRPGPTPDVDVRRRRVACGRSPASCRRA